MAKHWDGHAEKDVTRLLSLPAVVTQSNVNGEWRFDDFDGDGLDYQRSCCGGYSRNNFDLCPNCGAHMREPPKEEI